MIELQYKKTSSSTWLVATANFVDTYTIAGLDQEEYQVRKFDSETSLYSEVLSIVPDGSGSAVINSFYYDTEGNGDLSQPMVTGFYPQVYYDAASNHTYAAFMGRPLTPYNREPFVFKINHATGVASSPVGCGWLTENEDDGHMEPICIVAPDGHLLVATEDRHDSQIFIRRSVNPVPDISAFTENFAIVPATVVNYAYSSFVKRGTDLYLLVQDGGRRLSYHKSTDSGATWGPKVVVLDLGDNNHEIHPRIPVQSETGTFYFSCGLRRSIEADYPDGFFLSTDDFVSWTNVDGTFTKDVVNNSFIIKSELDDNDFSIGFIPFHVSVFNGNPFFIYDSKAYYYELGALISKPITSQGVLISYSDLIHEWIGIESVNGNDQLVRFRTEDKFDTFVKIQELSRFNGTWSVRTHRGVNFIKLTQNTDANKIMFLGAAPDTDHGDFLISQLLPVALPAAIPEAPVISATVIDDIITARWNYTLGNTSFKFYVSTDNFATHVSGYNGKILTSNIDTVTTLTPGATYSFRVKAVNASGESPFSNTTTVLVDSGIGLNPKDPSIADELAIYLSAYDITSSNYSETEGVKKLNYYPNTANSPINYSSNHFYPNTDTKPVYDDVNKKVIFSGAEWVAWKLSNQFHELKNNYGELFFVVRFKTSGVASHVWTCYRAIADQRVFRIYQTAIGSIGLEAWENDTTNKVVSVSGTTIGALGWHTAFCWIKDGEVGIQIDKLTPVTNTVFSSIERDNSTILAIAGYSDGVNVISDFPVMEQSHHILYVDPSRNNKADRDLMHDYFESLGQS